MKKVNNPMWMVLSLVGQTGIIIALPVAVLAYAGHRLDLKLNTSPLFILSGMGLSLLISGILIYRMIKKIEEK